MRRPVWLSMCCRRRFWASEPGPCPPRATSSPQSRYSAIWHGTKPEPGDGASPTTHPALLAVTVDEVLAQIDGMPGPWITSTT
jgi:hypothetical protein